MTAQSGAIAYVCLGCGSEGLLREEAAPGGRARCPQCGRAIEVESSERAALPAESAEGLLPTL
ncbi:MAG TPA: hypothetical protein VNM16_01245 [Bacillota bacterium]|nr:hypothetical protein [Bacillota bacterium]